jgi:Zn-dependent protease
MHITFLLLVGWVALVFWRQGQSVSAAVAGVAFILSVFLCVILHEFGHALAARRYGIKTRDIILLPIGGVARLEKMPTNPLHELWISIAGPAVNVAIAAALFIWLKLSASFDPLAVMTTTAGPFFERILVVNLFMIAFNMIPAFPMDGGRVLRAVLAMRSGHRRATQIAASIGQGIAVFFGVIGLFYNPFLMFIALFVWFGASQEARAAQLQSAVDGIEVQQAMLTDFRTLDKNDSLDQAVKLTLASSQKDFPVLENGRVEGILTQEDLMNALSDREKFPTVVSSAIQHKVEAAESFDMLDAAFDKLKNCDCKTLPVTLNSRLVGLLTMENLSEYLRIRAAATS